MIEHQGDRDFGLREKCGVVGVIGAGSVFKCMMGIKSLQHRGQEAYGIVAAFHECAAEEALFCHYGDGLVSEQSISRSVNGRWDEFDVAIGHVRYSTSGTKDEGANVQPLVFKWVDGGATSYAALAHNGNLTNALTLRSQLEASGAVFNTTMDTEVISALLCADQSAASISEKCLSALEQVDGAYSLVIMSDKFLIGVRDPLAIRPLVLGKISGGGFVLASESCALDAIDECHFVRDIAPGELILISCGDSREQYNVQSFKVRSSSQNAGQNPRHCLFEHVYFARPDSVLDGLSVSEARKAIGRILGTKYAVPGADIVVPIPESSVHAALGYSQASGVALEYGIHKNQYASRTFIQPGTASRQHALRLKHNINKAVVQGKVIVLVDDSIVRGATVRQLVKRIQEAGARTVHLRTASPPVMHCCFYGINTPDPDDLVALKTDVATLAKDIGVDTLEYCTLDDLYMATSGAKRDSQCPKFCDACFSGDYPAPLTDFEEARKYNEMLKGRKFK